MTTIVLFLACAAFGLVAGLFGAQLHTDLSQRPVCPICVTVSASVTALAGLGAVASWLVLVGVLP